MTAPAPTPPAPAPTQTPADGPRRPGRERLERRRGDNAGRWVSDADGHAGRRHRHRLRRAHRRVREAGRHQCSRRGHRQRRAHRRLRGAREPHRPARGRHRQGRHLRRGRDRRRLRCGHHPRHRRRGGLGDARAEHSRRRGRHRRRRAVRPVRDADRLEPASADSRPATASPTTSRSPSAPARRCSTPTPTGSPTAPRCSTEWTRCTPTPARVPRPYRSAITPPAPVVAFAVPARRPRPGPAVVGRSPAVRSSTCSTRRWRRSATVRVRRRGLRDRPDPERVGLRGVHPVVRVPGRCRRSPAARSSSTWTSRPRVCVIPVEQGMNTPGALLFHFSAEPTPGGGRPSQAHVALSLGDGTTVEAQSRSVGVIVDDNAGWTVRVRGAAAECRLLGRRASAAAVAMPTAAAALAGRGRRHRPDHRHGHPRHQDAGVARRLPGREPDEHGVRCLPVHRRHLGRLRRLRPRQRRAAGRAGREDARRHPGRVRPAG